VIQARSSRISPRVTVLAEIERRSAPKSVRRDSLCLPGIKDASSWVAVQSVPSNFVGQHFLRPMTPSSTSSALQPLGRMLTEHRLVDHGVQELMLHAIAQTAVSTFESTSMEIFAQDGYMIDECGQLRVKTFVYAESVRYRANHYVSTFQTALGCAWLRTTTIHHDDRSFKRRRKPQIIRSLIFYPTKWLQYMGIQTGFEAVVASGRRSWLFNCNIAVIRPVSDDSLIFELCRTGQTRAVEALLEKGLASVLDTSPRGWKPLHVRCYVRVEVSLEKRTLT
jgi:hypothetical protein